MKIALLGNFNVSYTSESHYAATFEQLGHTVVRLQEPTVRTNEIYRIAKESDMFFWVHTHGWESRGTLTMLEVLRLLEKDGIPTVAYHLDLYMGLKRWNEYYNHDYFKVKHFFTVDKLMAEWLNENTDTKGHYLPAGVFEQEAYMAKHESYDYDVVFVGSRRYHPEWPNREKLLQFLEQTYGKRFAHFGSDGKGVVRGSVLNRLYANTKVVVGDTLCPGFDYPFYWSDRIYETTGRGGVMLHPRIEGLESQFEDGKEVLLYSYGDFNDLKAKIDKLLTDSTYREQLRKDGHKRTIRDHTYTNRLQTILNTVKG